MNFVCSVFFLLFFVVSSNPIQTNKTNNEQHQDARCSDESRALALSEFDDATDSAAATFADRLLPLTHVFVGKDNTEPGFPGVSDANEILQSCSFVVCKRCI